MLPSLGLLVASALSYAPSSLLHRATTTARTPFIIAQQQPYRSDDKWDYFRLLRKVEVTLTKPLGAVLEETGQTAGTVKVDDLAEGGSALETGLLKKGDVLLTVMGEDDLGRPPLTTSWICLSTRRRRWSSACAAR